MGSSEDESDNVIENPVLFRALSENVLTVRRVAFSALRRSERLDPGHLAFETGLDPAAVEVALRWPDNAGLVEQDANDNVVGIAGLTLVSTKHQLEFDGQLLHTWCALDAVGIPAALSLDAYVMTTCESCGASLTIDIHDGEPPSDSPLRGWIPPTGCDNVRAEFCPLAEVFCSEEQLNEWRVSAGNRQGQPTDLRGFAELGRKEWGDFVTKENE